MRRRARRGASDPARDTAPAQPPTPPAPAHEPAPAVTLGGLLRGVALVGPPVTVATALLFYFGWATTHAQAAAMGLDESIFGMGTTDYVLRSLDALFVPVLVGSAALIAWSAFRARVVHDVESGAAGARRTPPAARVALHLWWVWAALTVALAVWWPPGRDLVVPLGLAVLVLLLHHRSVVRHRLDATSRDSHGPRRVLPSGRSTLVGVLVTALLFWEVAEYAEVVGRGRADAVVAAVGTRSGVVVFSERDLQLAPPVRTDEVGDETSRYRFRYEGLRLLQRTGDTWFLVPDDWQPGTRPLVALRDDAGMRLEFQGPPR
ncbi:hypothetical protein [Aquipuribacter nitratireducens]|uniref:Uncharacterized protein n=1 Tax=Aquipuribacter nitratireducens TaxID=650104 RepID=A0ABW0GIY5_9MICO